MAEDGGGVGTKSESALRRIRRINGRKSHACIHHASIMVRDVHALAMAAARPESVQVSPKDNTVDLDHDMFRLHL